MSKRRRTPALVTIAVLVGTLLAACTQPVPSSTSDPVPAASELASASPGPVGSMVTKVNKALSELAEKSPKPSQEQIRSTLQGLGVLANDVEVSVSKTPTGLEVDAIQGSVRVEKSCVIGQIREGKVAVTLQPVLSTGKCFIGDQR